MSQGTPAHQQQYKAGHKAH